MKLYNESYLGANLQLTIMYLRTVCVYLYTHVVSSWNETENYTELFKVFAFSLSQQAQFILCQIQLILLHCLYYLHMLTTALV